MWKSGGKVAGGIGGLVEKWGEVEGVFQLLFESDFELSDGADSPPGGLSELSRFGGRTLGPVPLISTAFGPTGIRGRSFFLFGMATSLQLAVCRSRRWILVPFLLLVLLLVIVFVAHLPSRHQAL